MSYLRPLKGTLYFEGSQHSPYMLVCVFLLGHLEYLTAVNSFTETILVQYLMLFFCETRTCDDQSVMVHLWDSTVI